MTGEGPGIMEAANKGAIDVNAVSIGLRSDALIDEEPGNDSVLTHKHLVHFLFSRRFIMSIKSNALIFYPGAYGTLTELFENTALISANLVDRVPVICIGKKYWEGLINWFKKEVEINHLTSNSKKYLEIIKIEDDINEIIKIIKNK